MRKKKTWKNSKKIQKILKKKIRSQVPNQVPGPDLGTWRTWVRVRRTRTQHFGSAASPASKRKFRGQEKTWPRPQRPRNTDLVWVLNRPHPEKIESGGGHCTGTRKSKIYQINPYFFKTKMYQKNVILYFYTIFCRVKISQKTWKKTGIFKW